MDAPAHGIQALLGLAIEHEASDLLLSVGSPAALRVDGVLRSVGERSLSAEELERTVEYLLAPAQRERLHHERHIDIGFTQVDRRWRGSVSFAESQPTVALRLFPRQVPSPAELGLPAAAMDLLQRPWGLVLVTGPTGHGKTTTVASMVDAINRREPKHIVTIEDPVEYVHTPHRSLVDHQEVGRDTPSFPAALRQVVRHSPDVIVVGEIRDRESVEAALTIAETGHLVLTTLHANDAVQAIDRLVTFFPRDQQPYIQGQLAMVTAAILNQRLVRSRQGGRVLAAEVLVNSHSVAHLIREGRTSQLHSALEAERSHGSLSMNHALGVLVDRGTVHVAEARRYLNPLESDVFGLGRGTE